MLNRLSGVSGDGGTTEAAIASAASAAVFALWRRLVIPRVATPDSAIGVVNASADAGASTYVCCCCIGADEEEGASAARIPPIGSECLADTPPTA
jgi:hypothetical protein